MIAIIFDLELVKRYKKGQLSEIVEIGACKVDIDTKTIVDQFQIYITPKSGYVSKSTRKFIKMSKDDAKNAVPFPIGIKEFVAWIGEDYYLCSWGKDDKAHFVNQCVRNKMNVHWFKNFNDIQKSISKLLSDQNKQLGLKRPPAKAGGFGHKMSTTKVVNYDSSHLEVPVLKQSQL